MPPRKKKIVKTPQKIKSSPSSFTAATENPSPSPLEPSFAADSVSSIVTSTDNDHRHVLQPELKVKIENELEAKPSPEPETVATAPASNPASEEVPALGENKAVTNSAEPNEKPVRRTVLRVRKVLKKKIVKKLVPKRSVAKKVDDVPVLDGLASLRQSSEKDLNPNSALYISIKDDATEGVFNHKALQKPDPVNVMPEAEDNVEIKKECRQTEAKDDFFKSRKVVRKIIVKKLVPKGSLAAKKVDVVPLQDGTVSMGENTEKELNPNSALVSIIQQDALEKSFNSDAYQQPEAKMEEDKKLESGISEDNEIIKEECGKMVAIDDNLESGKKGDGLEAEEVKEQEMMGLPERVKRRKAEIFIGGLDRDAKEEDIRSVFGKVGEILELRMMMDGKTGKNKGYAFLRYMEPSQAKRAVAEFAKVEIRGKTCGAAAVQGNDTIFLGNIEKKWKKEDVLILLKDAGIENIGTITVVMDPNNTDFNRGFAFLELETNKDAQRAYKKLQMKDALGKGRNIKVSWADSFNIPDEEDMKKVKSLYVEGVPDSWDEDRLMETFKKFGEIERIVLGKNIKSAKRRDIAFINYKIREAALSCIGSFSSGELIDNGSKVNLKVALAKRVQKVNQNKVQGQKSTINNSIKEAYKPLQGLPSQDYSPVVLGTKRTFSTLRDGMHSDLRYTRRHLDSSFGIAGSSYTMMPHGGAGSSLHYKHQSVPAGYSTASFYRSGSKADTDTYQIRREDPLYSSNLYHRYQM